ncbi:hypothetical protein C8Q77DRAFT_1134045 [Trametes polyzona]|nr:hypothetical protein C8Q77DRAFT_1134045 [Trametes polyzona]
MSTPERHQALRAQKGHLLSLAEELIGIILLELEAADILTCTKVCHALADIIERTPGIQYKLQLGLAGMVDGPARDVPVGKRLEQLRAYQAAWRANDIPMQFANVPPEAIRHYRALLRPASAFSGITEEALSIEYGGHLGESPNDIQGSAFDLSQDLAILTKLELGEYPEMYILSLSQGGKPHPLAAQPEIAGDEPLGISLDPNERLEISGDLVAWTLSTDATDIQVLNWKTGKGVWRTGRWHENNPYFYMRCHFLDPTHVVVVENGELRVHEVDPETHTPERDTCVLKLPALTGRMSMHGVQSDIGRPPAYPGSTALFVRDPALTILAVMFSACPDPYGYDHQACKTFLALIPVSTLLDQFERAKEREGADGAAQRGHGAPAAVPWEDWGAKSARIVQLKHDKRSNMNALGAQCMLVPDHVGENTTEVDVYVLDVHPLAGHAPHAALDVQDTVCVSECITDPKWFVGPVRSGAPLRIAHKKYAVPKTSGWLGPPELSHDSLLKFVYGSA